MVENSRVAILYSSEFSKQAEQLSKKLNLEVCSKPNNHFDFFLNYSFQGLELISTDPSLGNPLIVDFSSGAADHRRRFGGGKSQDISKAVGINKKDGITVLDATAGLGRDAFVLATLGCRVTLCERNPIVFALLEDGLNRAKLSTELSEISARMTLFEGDAQNLELMPPEVIFLDPMFPERKKSAQVKKEMQVFHRLVGEDMDNQDILRWAIGLALARVVVKRPKIAPFIDERKPTMEFKGKSGRFDVYVIKALSSQ